MMKRYGDLTSAQAEAAALDWYPYEPSNEPFRGLVFHEDAWGWAMQRIYGDCYWVDRPELAQPSPEYEALD